MAYIYSRTFYQISFKCINFNVESSIADTSVVLRRYVKDNRSIPVSGNEDVGTESIPESAVFQVKNGTVFFVEPASGLSTSIGSYCQYQVITGL